MNKFLYISTVALPADVQDDGSGWRCDTEKKGNKKNETNNVMYLTL